jgi:pSer/pThr/pTyr-binding forkhead associated (FHA) protein
MTATVVLLLRIALAVVLYLFLWRIFQVIWQEVKQQGILIVSQEKPSIHIQISLPDDSGKKYHFRQDTIMIGRASSCDIPITDDVVSAAHAQVSYHHKQWWLEDAGSTNGTFLNGDKITVPTVIITGDSFQCGKTSFEIRIDQSQIESNSGS